MSTAEREIARYQWLSTAEAGAIAGGVTSETVLGWIHQPNGLKAMDIGTKARPEYKIKPEWLNDFMALRTRNAK